jgi:YVTN family beta-propeller protein
MLLMGGLGAATAPVAGAATPACGPSCISLFSAFYGTASAPGFVLDDPTGSQTTGTPVVLGSASSVDVGEDFTPESVDLVSDYYQAGLVSQGMEDYYGSLNALEIDYTPSGAATGQCLGVATSPGNGTPVTLQPCGVSARTLWVLDPVSTSASSHFTFISAATSSSYAHPYELSAPQPGLPLYTYAAQSIDDRSFPTQLWGDVAGVLPAKAAAAPGPFTDVTAPIASGADAVPSGRGAAPGPSDPAVTPAPASAYVPTLIEGALTGVDVPNPSVGAPLPVGETPDAVAITPDGQTAYVADGTGDAVTPVALPTDTVGTPISVGGWAYAVAITPDGKTAYVTGFNTNTVTPITVSTNKAGTAIPVGNGPDAVAITPDGKTAYVANFNDGTVTPITVATNKAGTAVDVGGGPSAIAITPDGKTAYVTNYTDGTVTPITVATNKAGKAIPVGGGPDAVAVTPDDQTAYVANSSDGTVTAIDVASNTTGDVIPVGGYPDGVAVTPDGTTALVTNWFDGTATPIAVATNTPGAAIDLQGAGPDGVAIAAALQIGNDPALPPGTLGSGYTQQLWSVAGTIPFTYSLMSGSLPQGLHISSSGAITGTPTEQGAASFTVKVTDSSSTIQTATKAFTLTVDAPPAVTTQPTGQTVTAGASPTFTAAFSGTPSPTIQWQVSSDNGATFTDIAGATSSTLTLSGATLSQSGDQYRALGSNTLASNVASDAATLKVNPSAAPLNIAAPTISGSGKPGQALTCGGGSWTNDPTSYRYEWSRDGTPIAGATKSTYTVAAVDEGNTLTCTVTATNEIGTSSGVNSAGVNIQVPFKAHCPAATGKLSGTTLGLVTLGMTVAQARHAYTRSSDRGNAYKDFFCLTPYGVRVGYASPKLLRSLSSSERGKLKGRVVWISTDNARYADHGIRAGSTLQAAEKALPHGYYFRVGLNYWYLAPAGAATAVLKVRNEIVDEVGIADKALTGSHKADRTLMTSFD